MMCIRNVKKISICSLWQKLKICDLSWNPFLTPTVFDKELNEKCLTNPFLYFIPLPASPIVWLFSSFTKPPKLPQNKPISVIIWMNNNNNKNINFRTINQNSYWNTNSFTFTYTLSHTNKTSQYTRNIQYVYQQSRTKLCMHYPNEIPCRPPKNLPTHPFLYHPLSSIYFLYRFVHWKFNVIFSKSGCILIYL